MTFEELRAEAQKAYKEVLAADEERKNDKTIARLSELYVESYVNEKRRERDAAFREYVISCVEELRELVSSVITEKRNGLDKMLSTPPTSEQLSLLTALQVRGEDISEVTSTRWLILLPSHIGLSCTCVSLRGIPLRKRQK